MQNAVSDIHLEKRDKKCTEPGLTRGLFAEAIGELVPPKIDEPRDKLLFLLSQRVLEL